MISTDWTRIKAVLDRALALPPDARAAFLADECREDAAFRSEIDSLLAASDEAGAFMEAPAGRALVDGDRTSLGPQRLGRYRVEREIGRGGMATVYLAVRDDGEYVKRVAIKIVQQAFGSESLIARFRQERQILADLDHPNIARLLDGGTTPDGTPYLVLEHIDGSPIDAYCDERQLSLADRLALFCDVCGAVAYAHARHVVHRDLKPTNVLVTRAGTVKLLDFGIAKLLDGGDARLDRTITGWQLMTPEYGSPEQIRGESVSMPADVYALGVLLVKLVSGRSPYRPRNNQPHELARAICEDDPAAPGVDADLDAIALKALSKHPRDRYGSADELAADIRRYLNRVPVVAPRMNGARRLWRAARRTRVSAAAAVLAIAILALAGIRTLRLAGAVESRGGTMTATDLTTVEGELTAPAFSPDGNSIAFIWSGDPSAGAPGGIYRVPVRGGPPVRLTTGAARGEEWPAWSPDATRIAFVREAPGASGIYVIPSSGGPERKLLALPDDRYYWLAWSPDGKHIAFADRAAGDDRYVVSLLNVDTAERRPLFPRAGARVSVLRFAFSPDGQTLALILTGVPEGVDVDLLPLSTMVPRTVLAHPEWVGGVSWTADGRAVVLSLNQHGRRQLVRVPVAGGRPEPLPVDSRDAYFPAIAAKGDRLAFVRDESDTDIWRVDLNAASGTGSPAALIRSTRRDAEPRFSPDGKKVAFQSNRSGSLEIWLSDANGTNQVQVTSFGGPTTAWPMWSPDGRQILFWGPDAALHIVAPSGGPTRRVNAQERGGETASWSHDGEWIYFTSGTARNVWKMPVRGGRAIQVTTTGGFAPRESVDGRFVYYLKNDMTGIWRTPVSGGPETRVVDVFPGYWPDYWEVVEDGIYYAGDERVANPPLKFLNLTTRHTSTAATLVGPLVPWGGGLTVSPDRRSVLYTRDTYSRSEIVLVENFK